MKWEREELTDTLKLVKSGLSTTMKFASASDAKSFRWALYAHRRRHAPSVRFSAAIIQHSLIISPLRTKRKPREPRVNGEQKR